jgi:prepilin-type N-terminal cleavage/methylation domain-containing protein
MLHTHTKGFTLIEVMVSMSIVALMMAVILFNYSVFTDNLALTAAGQEMIIAIREAQVYGLTVKEVSVGGGNFNSAYGIYFNPTTDPSSYYIFADTNADKKYTPGSGCGSGSTECVQKISLRNNITISSICDATDCPPSGATGATSIFLRPNPDASIYFMDSLGVIRESLANQVKVNLMSPKGKIATVVIKSVGLVVVQ